MRIVITAILTGLLALVTGCQTKGDHDHAKADPSHAKADPSHAKADHTHAKAGDPKVATAAKAAQDKPPCAHVNDPAGADDHAHDDHSKDPIAAGEGAVNPHGPMDEKLGAALAGAETVDVATLVQDPAKFDGKTITLKGEVADMCFHRRGWFAVASEDGKKMVRVVTGPAGFQVPAGAMGATATCEGAVKVVTLNEKQIAYFRRSHKFISDEEARKGGPIKQAILMASGAEFKR